MKTLHPKKTSTTKSRTKKIRRQSGLAVAALVSVPLLTLSPDAAAQGSAGGAPAEQDSGAAAVDTFMFAKQGIKIKFMKNYDGEYTLLGLSEGRTIFMTQEEEYFSIDPATGDKQTISDVEIRKLTDEGNAGQSGLAKKGTRKKATARSSTTTGVDESSVPVRIIGMNSAGDIIMMNSHDEMFYLDPNTGDMVFVE